MTNYEIDPRPLAECLKAFALDCNDGKAYGARGKAAAELRITDKTLQNWMDGTNCPYEATIRRLMTMISCQKNGK